MEEFPGQWKDTPKKRDEQWAQMQRNEAFVRSQQGSPGGLACAYCGKANLRIHHWSEDCAPNDATADHVTPRSRGGGDQTSNLVVACRQCNLRKGDH